MSTTDSSVLMDPGALLSLLERKRQARSRQLVHSPQVHRKGCGRRLQRGPGSFKCAAAVLLRKGDGRRRDCHWSKGMQGSHTSGSLE